jgi:serralysin
MATYTIFHPIGHTSGLNMDGLLFVQLDSMSVAVRSTTTLSLTLAIPLGYPGDAMSSAAISGVGLGYSALGHLLVGDVQGFSLTHYTPPGFLQEITVSGITNVSGAQLGAAITANDNAGVWSLVLNGADDGHGSDAADLMRGYGGNDTLNGDLGADTIWGGTGNDLIYAAFAPGGGAAKTDSTYLRGEEGNDTIVGSNGFDDINGNMGDDSLSGGNGADWVVGGKDNDNQAGDAGDDIVWGYLGNDTLDGGDGKYQVRGGQGDDIVNGGAGNDYVSGDRGNDTITGGAGADIFHDSQDAGIDRVLDFNLAEGDKVMLDPGTIFTVSQVGADTVIDMGSGNQMILVGVQASSLPAGTIFLG